MIDRRFTTLDVINQWAVLVVMVTIVVLIVFQLIPEVKKTVEQGKQANETLELIRQRVSEQTWQEIEPSLRKNR